MKKSLNSLLQFRKLMIKETEHHLGLDENLNHIQGLFEKLWEPLKK